VANGALERARVRVKNLGSRTAALAAIPQVPIGKRFVFAQAIREEFPLDLGAVPATQALEQEAPIIGQPELMTPTPLQESAPEVRAMVSGLPQPARFAAEAGPSILGGVLGAFSPVPPVGAGVLGFAGEKFAQESGLAPPSPFQQAAAAVAPGVVRGGAAVFRGSARFLSKFPLVKPALAAIEQSATLIAAKNLGADVLSATKGLMAKSANVLFRALRARKNIFSADDFPGTMKVLADVEKSVGKFGSLEEAGRLLETVQQLRAAITEGIDFADLSAFRRILGVQIGKFERAGGPRLGGAKGIFGTLFDDIEKLTRRGQGIKPNTEIFGIAKGVDLFKAAPARAKLEFAVQDLDGLIERWTRTITGQGGEEAMTAKAILDRLNSWTNPKSELFDKNFTSAMAGHIEDLKKFFIKANSIEGSGVKGPGRLFEAGRMAKLGEVMTSTGAGFLTGGLVSQGNPIVQTTGALLGLQLPGQLTKLLLTPGGRAFTERLLRAGQGRLSPRALSLIGVAANELGQRPLTELASEGTRRVGRALGP